MSRNELKDIIARVIVRLENEAPKPACLFNDNPPDPDPCDMTTRYAVGEEG
jgi:hypothetical protein